MKSYLLPGLDAAQRQRLRDAGVTNYEWAGDTLVEETQIQAALRTLGVASFTEQATEYENVFKVALRYSTGDTRVTQNNAMDPNSPRARAREQYIKVCSVRVQAVVDQASQVMVAQQKTLPPALNTFALTARAAAFGGAQNESAKRAELLEEIQRLREIPQVREVRVLPGYLYVYTRKLYAADRESRRKHEIGEFLFRIRFDGREGGIRFFNATRRVDGVRRQMNAPNVYADGSPVADEMVQTFVELIAQCQFAVVAELAIQFIETMNNDELSRTLDRWPLATS